MPALSTTLFGEKETMASMQSDHNDSSQILAITGCWCFLAVVIVSMKVYTRAIMVKYFGWDDVATVITMIIGIGVFACFVGETHWGLGRHAASITATDLVEYAKYQFAHSMLLLLALQGMKIAFMLFLIRLSASRVFRITLIAVVGFMTIYTIASWLVLLLSCVPISANWTQEPARCISTHSFVALGLSDSVFGIVTNAVLALIPIPIVYGMELNWRAKGCLIIAFGMGIVTVVCGAVKTYYQYYYFGNSDRLYQDSYFVWGALELFIGIIAASLVSLKPLLGKFVDKATTTIATSVDSSQPLHVTSPKMQTPKLREKEIFDDKQFDCSRNFPQLDCSRNFPKIEVSSYHSDEMSITGEKLTLAPLTSHPPDGPATFHHQTPQIVEPKSEKKAKRRPRPLDPAVWNREIVMEVFATRGIKTSPSPKDLPAGEKHDLPDLVQGRDSDVIEQSQGSSLRSSRAPSIDTIMTATTPSPTRYSLTVPILSRVITSPSPTYLPTDTDFNFFDLCKGRDPETLATTSRPLTMCSVPEDSEWVKRASIRESRIVSGDFSECAALVQTVKKVSAGDVKRPPSDAPSASSAYLCPPVSDRFRESQMYFHVIPSGQFPKRSATLLSPPESPISPRSFAPKKRHSNQSSVVSWNDSVVTRDRADSADALINKVE